jgi:ribosomal-protein-alanine N-acetyltransferase
MLTGRSLQTARLRLEELAPGHAAEYLSYRSRNRTHLERWEPATGPGAFTAAYQASEIATSLTLARAGESVRFVAFEKRGTDIVASVNLWSIRRGVSESAILGYSVDANYEGRGFATESAQAVVEFAFSTLGLHRIETSYQPVNERSGRVLRKLGFVVEGYARHYLFLDNAWRDAVLASRTNDAWKRGPND